MTETDHPSCSKGPCPKRPPTGGRGELVLAMNIRGKAVPGGLTWITLQDEAVSVFLFFLQDPHQGRGQFRTGYVTLGLWAVPGQPRGRVSEALTGHQLRVEVRQAPALRRADAPPPHRSRPQHAKATSTDQGWERQPRRQPRHRDRHLRPLRSVPASPETVTSPASSVQRTPRVTPSSHPTRPALLDTPNCACEPAPPLVISLTSVSVQASRPRTVSGRTRRETDQPGCVWTGTLWLSAHLCVLSSRLRSMLRGREPPAASPPAGKGAQKEAGRQGKRCLLHRSGGRPEPTLWQLFGRHVSKRGWKQTRRPAVALRSRPTPRWGEEERDVGRRPAGCRGGKPPGTPSLLPRRRAQPLRSRCGAAPCPRRSPARLSSLQPRVRAALAPRRSPGSAPRGPSSFAFIPVPSAEPRTARGLPSGPPSGPVSTLIFIF